MARSGGNGGTGTVAVAESFAEFASPAVATVAVLSSVSGASPATSTVSVNPADPPGSSVPLKVQVSVVATGIRQAQPVPKADTNDVPVGSGSVTVTGPVVDPAPTLVTVSW